jgi:hypothetical protein
LTMAGAFKSWRRRRVSLPGTDTLQHEQMVRFVTSTRAKQYCTRPPSARDVYR